AREPREWMESDMHENRARFLAYNDLWARSACFGNKNDGESVSIMERLQQAGAIIPRRLACFAETEKHRNPERTEMLALHCLRILQSCAFSMSRLLKISPFDPYRPELRYMRGPGPKWREKHARSDGFVS